MIFAFPQAILNTGTPNRLYLKEYFASLELAGTMRRRIFFYLFMGLIPMTVLALYLAVDERNEEEARARTEVEASVNVVRSDLDRLFEVSRGVLASLSAEASEADACRALIPLRRSFPEVFNIGMYDLLPGESRGHTVCAATPAATEPFPLSDEEIRLHDALHTPGELNYGAIRGNSVDGRPVIPVCQLVRMLDGGGRRLVTVTIALDKIRARVGAMTVPGEGRIVVLDRDGVIAAVNPGSVLTAGRPAPDFERALATRADFVGEMPDADGATSLYAVAHAGGLTAILKARDSAIFMRSRMRLGLHLTGLLVVCLSVFWIAWTNSTRYVARPLARLVEVADRIAKGNLGERTGLEYTGELGGLARSFDMMAEFLQQDEVRGAQMLEALRALTARLDSVGEEERTRIAREIHDELGQQLTAMRFELARLDQSIGQSIGQGAEQNPGKTPVSAKVQDLTATVDVAIRDMRKIATALRPAVLDYGGLTDSIRYLAEDFERRTGIACTVLLPEKLDVGDQLATCLFRICQESLTNVARHAQATAVEIRLVSDAGSLALTVRDNGRGFSTEGAAQTTSLGLLGMRERARMAGGILSLISAPGEGTTVLAWIPATGGAHSGDALAAFV